MARSLRHRSIDVIADTRSVQAGLKSLRVYSRNNSGGIESRRRILPLDHKRFYCSDRPMLRVSISRYSRNQHSQIGCGRWEVAQSVRAEFRRPERQPRGKPTESGARRHRRGRIGLDGVASDRREPKQSWLRQWEQLEAPRMDRVGLWASSWFRCHRYLRFVGRARSSLWV